jgi:hypothetical protein
MGSRSCAGTLQCRCDKHLPLENGVRHLSHETIPIQQVPTTATRPGRDPEEREHPMSGTHSDPHRSPGDERPATWAAQAPVAPSMSVNGRSPGPMRANHHPGQGKRSSARELQSRLLPYFLIVGVGEIGLLLGLRLTGEVVFVLGMLALLLGLLTIGHLVTRRHLRHCQDQKRGQAPAAKH